MGIKTTQDNWALKHPTQHRRSKGVACWAVNAAMDPMACLAVIGSSSAKQLPHSHMITAAGWFGSHAGSAKRSHSSWSQWQRASFHAVSMLCHTQLTGAIPTAGRHPHIPVLLLSCSLRPPVTTTQQRAQGRPTFHWQGWNLAWGRGGIGLVSGRAALIHKLNAFAHFRPALGRIHNAPPWARWVLLCILALVCVFVGCSPGVILKLPLCFCCHHRWC